jgi:hypothetical protein
MTMMESTVYFKELCLDDAKAVAGLEAKLFPSNQQNGLRKLEEIFLANAVYGSKLSIGLFNQSNLLGYHLSYPKGLVRSAHSRHEQKILFSDLAILPEYRSYSNATISQGLAACRLFFPDRPVHMFCFPYYKDKWTKRADIYLKNGYRLSRCDHFYSARFRQVCFQLRWEPMGTSLHSVKLRCRFRLSALIALGLHRIKRLIESRKRM